MQRAHKKYFYLLLLSTLTYLYASAALSTNLFNLATAIRIDRIQGYGLDLHDVVLDFDVLNKEASSYSIHIGSAKLPENKGLIKDVTLQCSEGVISKHILACHDGELSFQDPIASAKNAKITFDKNEQGDLSLELHNFKLAGGIASLSMKMLNDVWHAELDSQNVSFGVLKKMLPSFPGFISEGFVTSRIHIVGEGKSLSNINGNARVRELTFSNEDSTVVGEKVSAKVIFSSDRNLNIWKSEINTTTFKGELYFDPVFIDANEGAKDLYGKIDWQVGSNQIALRSLHYEDVKALNLKIDTVIDFDKKAAISPVQIDIQYAVFPHVYEKYMLPFLLETNVADLSTNGSLSGSILIDGDRVVDTDLDLNHLIFEDNQNRFSISNLNGSIGWGKRYSGKDYTFSFDAADIYKLRLDASQFAFSNEANSLILKQPVSVPMLDGAVNIENFQVKNPGSEDQSTVMDISLTPVSMTKLSRAFGWPEMNGNLAGYAPNVTYKGGDVDIQGALLIRGFGGTTTIHNLSAEDLFSITPKMSADLQLNNLNLSSLTETFSFGEITGRLEGSIKNLQFVNWSPVHFDAWFGTPAEDNSRHRISQTAVDNLTQVGNGGANILSKSFLKFFDSFGYDKLGLGCTLKNNICHMRGVNVSTQSDSRGFYIVKGSGIPRIDIVGFTDEVSWPVLIARLKRVVSTKDVIVN